MRTLPFLMILVILCSSIGSYAGSSSAKIGDEAIGAVKSRVLIVQDLMATDAFKPNPAVVKRMVDRAITDFSGTRGVAAAWRTIVSPSDVIGLKVYALPGALSGTRKPVVEAIIEGLLVAGIPPTNIVIWDKHAIDLRLAGFHALAERLGVRVASSADAGYDYSAFYDSPLLGNLVWGDFEFSKGNENMGRKSYVSRLVSQELTKIVNVTPLLNHNLAGVSGNLYGLAAGSVDNFARFEHDPARLAQAVPEIYALQSVGDKVVLNVTDALICQYEGGERALLHYSTPLDELWFSKDPVALDTLALGEMVRQRERFMNGVQKPNYALYANAALLELGINDTNRINIQRVALGND